MKIKKYIFFLLFCSTVIFAQKWDNFTTENSPLPSNQVNSISISSDGTIWFATDNGLAALNNGTWKVYTNSEGLSNNDINEVAFLPESENDLWLATNKGTSNFQVTSSDISSDINYISRENTSLLSDTVLSVGMDTWSNQWLGTISGLSIITDKGIHNYSVENGFYNSTINSINTDADDWVQVATNGGGVSRLKYNGVDAITSASTILKQWSLLASDTVLTIFVTDDTLKWYGTPDGVSTHFGDLTKDGPITEGGSWWIYNTFTSDIIDNYCRAINRDENGNMWFGTRGGLSELKIDKTWQSYTEADGLASNNIFDIKIDSEGNLWIATDNGVSKLSEVSTDVETPNSLPEYSELRLKAYPNPFNPSTNIEFTLVENSSVKISIYNLLGEVVKSMTERDYSAGVHSIKWNSDNQSGNIVKSGIYIVTVSTKHKSISKKIVLLK